jgi:flagellar assembly factor FliW
MRKVKQKPAMENRVINNKFGEVVVNSANSIHFPLGILGMSVYKEFHLIPCPVEKFSQFLLMQSAQTDELVFMVLPIDPENPKYIKDKDLDEAYAQVDIKKKNASIVLIASTKEDEEGRKRITVNSRAPVFIDVTKKTAIQYVLQNNEYDVQQIV